MHAGLIGVAQDDGGALRPVAGWYLAHARAEIEDVIDRLVREHDATPPWPGSLLDGTDELVALYHRVGAATLFGGAWRLLPVVEHGRIPRGYPNPYLLTIMSAPGARCLAAATDLAGETMHWVICRVEDLEADPSGLAGRRQRLLDRPAEIPVYGTSLALVLEAILDGGDLTHLETGRLDQLDGTHQPPRPASTSSPRRAPIEPGPNADLDEIRAAKETAIDREEFELAARLRDHEKALLRERAHGRRTDRS